MARMNTRRVLARNLKALILDATPAGEKPSVRAWALGKGLDVRMIDRLTKGEHAVTLDKLEQIADACGLKAWHLLLEEFEPGDTPLAPITDEERRLLARLRKLLG
jgi:transcriptional regulator with XRE-family HTH domain